MTPDQESLETVRANLLEEGGSYVANQREDLLAVLRILGDRQNAAGRIDAVNWKIVDALRIGIRNAPDVKELYHERVQLLTLFDGLDALEDAVVSRSVFAPPIPADPEPAPPADPDPA